MRSLIRRSSSYVLTLTLVATRFFILRYSMEKELDLLRKKLFYKSNHRGIKELDLLLGAFSRHFLQILTKNELFEYETLLDANDYDIFEWLNGIKPSPVPLCESLINKFSTFPFHNHLIEKNETA
jgi:antitoxin CptB